ncbi:MAG: hypothetical protein RR620_13220 [Clostridium sp.]
MKKSEVCQKEYLKLKEIFKNVEVEKQGLVEGLIIDASFLFSENYELRELMDKTGGMVKVNLNNLSMQKQTEAGKQYLKNINSYSVIIKTLNGILMKNTVEDEDEYDKWVKGKRMENEKSED